MNNHDWQSLLRESFDYDLYANRTWLPFINGGGTDEERAIYNHILAASTVWVTRLAGVSLTAMPTVPLVEETLVELHRKWLEAVGTWEFDRVVDYRNTKGETGSRAFGDIARHVINHGTYHRGQIRGSFGARGAEFPDTDFILYSYERDEAR